MAIICSKSIAKSGPDLFIRRRVRAIITLIELSGLHQMHEEYRALLYPWVAIATRIIIATDSDHVLVIAILAKCRHAFTSNWL
jgi:hypothetical protein